MVATPAPLPLDITEDHRSVDRVSARALRLALLPSEEEHAAADLVRVAGGRRRPLVLALARVERALAAEPSAVVEVAAGHLRRAITRLRSPATAELESLLLRDGTTIGVRPIHRADADRLLRFHHTLSPETTRWRFFTFHPELSTDELHRFTNVDHRNREALVAIVDDEIVGVARWDRLDDRRAEVAFVIADAWQGRGLGGALFGALAVHARRAGVDHFVAETLGDNQRMLEVFRRGGVPLRTRFADGVVHADMDLTAARMTA